MTNFQKIKILSVFFLVYLCPYNIKFDMFKEYRAMEQWPSDGAMA